MGLTKKIIRISVVPAIIIIMVFIYSGLVPGCGRPDSGTGAVKEGQLTIYGKRLLVGTDATYPPFEYMEDGAARGFDIDIASEIASRLDKEMEIVPIDWDFTYKIPEDIKLDMIVSAVSADGTKEGFVDFSEPYYTLEYLMVILADAELKIKEDLIGKKVGMIDSRVKDLDPGYLKNYSIIDYKEIIPMMEDLRNRKIDGVFVSVPVGKNIIEENSGIYRVLEVVKSQKAFNIVFHEGSPLKEEVDRILAEMAADGTYKEIYDSWFSFPGQ